MTKTRLKRGAEPKGARRGVPRRKGAAKIGMIDRILRKLPVSEKGLQKSVTVLLVGGVAIAGVAVAEASGVFVYAGSRVADIASDNGYRVRHLVVDGMNNIEATEVYSIIADQKDRSMPRVDVDAVRGDLMELSWVADARVMRRLPDTLVVEIEERVPTAIWRDGQKHALIDSSGHILEMVEAGYRPDLPRLTGPQANRMAEQLARLLDVAPALKDQVAGAEWVGNRRWNLGFHTGEQLQLPEGEAAAEDALLKFARFDGVNRLLGRDLINFDMRDPRNLYVRKEPEVVENPSSDDAEG